MTVKSILDLKGRDIVTVSPDKTLVDAARLLADNHIGAVVVVDEGGIIHGILSERDLVRAIAGTDDNPRELPIAQFMTRRVTVCEESTTVNEVMRTMTRGRFRHIPVTRDGRIVGIISIGDVVKRRIEEAEREAAEIKAYIAMT